MAKDSKVIEELQEARRRMLKRAAGIGEPAIAIPAHMLGIIGLEEGRPQVLIQVDKLISLVKEVIATK